ncbi:guanylate kinase [Acidobacteriota bacterium]
MLFIITGPSGCGKSSIVQKVLEEMEAVEFCVSHTTRKKRSSEQEGRDYYFVSQQDFELMIRENKLAEFAVVHGNYYGSSKKEIEKKGTRADLLLDIDVQGARQIKGKFKKAAFIFVLPPSFQELKKRLEDRGQESPESIKERLENAKKEIRHYSQFDYIIINDQVDKAVESLRSIIQNKRCRLSVLQKKVMYIIQSFSEGE